jgi:hypothetical protein
MILRYLRSFHNISEYLLKGKTLKNIIGFKLIEFIECFSE